MHSLVPVEVLYAGLAGTLLALVVATAQQKWSCKVFFLLALRLAIGWHFLFEGLHKLHSYYTGPTDTNRVFTSEPYFRVAPGPLGSLMRKQFGDPNEVIAARVKAPREMSPWAFDRLSQTEQAAECPPAVAAEFDALRDQAGEAVNVEKAMQKIDAEEKASLDQIGKMEAEKLKVVDADHRQEVQDDYKSWRAKVKTDAEDRRKAVKQKYGSYPDGDQLLTAAKATYARWVYGVEGRDCKVKGVTGDASLTAPQRLEHLDWLRREVKLAEDRQEPGLGAGNGIDVKRAAEWRTDLVTAEMDLARDANAFVAELKKVLNGGKEPEEKAEPTLGQTMDKVTMWFLVVVGSFLLAGLFTRLSCVLAAGFLVMTYLAFPAFPWYPVAPNTEGNPLFVNKNVIECLALLAIACFPTGRWMGLDAVVSRIRFRRKEDAPAAAA